MSGLFGGIYDSIFGEGGDAEAQRSLEQIQNIPLPILKEMHPELYKQVVSMNPELESAVTLGPSASEGITLDPKYQQAQMDALNSLMDITTNDGRDARFQADAQRLQNDVNTNLKGNSDAITQNMAMRGMSGGMSEMVNRQINAQQGANRQAQMEMDLNAQASDRALAALMNQGNMAGQMESNDFNQQMSKANNQDAISKFNTQNQQQVMSNNVANKNNAQQFNAQNQQDIANSNADLRNDAQNWNSNGMSQQNYSNQMSKAGAVADQYGNIANRKDKKRDASAAFAGNMISAGTSAYAGGRK